MDQSSTITSEDYSNNEEDSNNNSEILIIDDPSLSEREKEDSPYEDPDRNSFHCRKECQEASLNPLVWQKFQYLLSVLKDIQNNILEMDSLILDQNGEKNSNRNSMSDKLINNSPMNHLVNTVESSKTDEAKLNEILGLLHCITRTLSSFEQNPLLSDELKRDFEEKINFSSTLMTNNEPVHTVVGSETYVNSNRDAFTPYPVHHFTKETTTLRKEIEDAIHRKKVLDERLNSLIIQRQNCQVDTVTKKEPTSLTAEGSHIPEQNENEKESIACLSIHSGNGSSKNSIVDESVIMDLRQDENEIPGLAESALSSEISSLGVTINNILEENKQLHAICNDFAEPFCVAEKKETNEGEIKGAKPKEKKFKKKSSKKFPVDRKNCQENDHSERDKLLESSLPLSLPYLKKAFDKKLKELLKEQTDIIFELNGEKMLFNEKTRNLERFVADLMRINRDNRMKYVEEVQAVDVENCRLEDELFSLKRENQKLTKENLRLKIQENISLELHNRGTEKFALCSCSSHCLCHNKSPEYIQLLLKHRELKNTSNMSKELKKCCNLRQKLMNEIPTCHLSSSESNLNNQEVLLDDHKFSSLPIIITPAESNPSKDNKEYVEKSCNSELNLLKERIDCLESHVNQRINGERLLNRTSEAFSSVDIDHDPSVSFHSPTNSAVAVSHEINTLKYKQKISSLSKENEELVKRVEELMGMIKELSTLVRSTKEELLLTRKERNMLLEKFKKKIESDDFDQAITNSEGFIRVLELNQKLQEKCSHLQLDLEKAWNEVQKNASERDKMVAEKEALNQFVTSSLADIEEENSSLKVALKKLEEKTLERSFAKNEVERTNRHAQTEYVFIQDEDKDVEEAQSKSENSKKSEMELNNNGSRENEINAHWQKSLLWLQRCFAEEKLHNQVLEAAERENSARVAVLQQRVKERGEKYQELLAKYKKLHLMLLASKVEKKASKRIFKECSSKIEEYNSTTTAIEDNYKIMLSSLGNNIGIAVEILSSHLYFSPSQVHPSPELSADPAFWFAAQCSRLRWLQTQLRKLCLHSWKNNDFISVDVKNIRNCNDKSIGERYATGRSFDLDDRPDNWNSSVLKTSYSTPASPSRLVEVESKENIEKGSELTNLQSTGVSNILSSLNDAELNLTSQQVELTRSKNMQFNNLVGMLKRNGEDGNPVSLVSSITSNVISPKNSEPFVDDNIDSTDNTISETDGQISSKHN